MLLNQAHAPASLSSFTVAGDGSTAVVSSGTGVASLSVVAPDLFQGTVMFGSTPTASGSGFKLLEVRPLGRGSVGVSAGWVVPVDA